MVLTGGEDAHRLAVCEGEHGHLHALDVVFYDYQVARAAEFLLLKHHAAGGDGLIVTFGEKGPFAGREAVRLDYERRAALRKGGLAFVEVGAEVEVGGRDAVPFHELLGEGFAALKAGA